MGKVFDSISSFVLCSFYVSVSVPCFLLHFFSFPVTCTYFLKFSSICLSSVPRFLFFPCYLYIYLKFCFIFFLLLPNMLCKNVLKPFHVNNVSFFFLCKSIFYVTKKSKLHHKLKVLWKTLELLKSFFFCQCILVIRTFTFTLHTIF